MPDQRTCKNCDGRGFYMYREGQPEHILLNPRYTCQACNGTGRGGSS